MTKEEAIEFLSNTKVYVDGKSKELQEKLFKLGYKWNLSSSSGIHNEDRPFIYIYSDMTLTWSDNMITFKNHKHKEIKVDDILNLKIIIDYILKPFDKVLVRDFNAEKWKIELFEKYDKTDVNYPYICLTYRYRQCIPYDGNEHLLGTTNNPE